MPFVPTYSVVRARFAVMKSGATLDANGEPGTAVSAPVVALIEYPLTLFEFVLAENRNRAGGAGKFRCPIGAV